jgi:hypothetical protein
MIRVGFEPTRFLTSKLISGEPETSAITTRPSDQSEEESLDISFVRRVSKNKARNVRS